MDFEQTVELQREGEEVSQTQRVESGYSFWDTHQCWDTHWPPAGTLLTQVVGHWGRGGDDDWNSSNQGNCAGDIFIGGCHSFLIGRGGK